MTALPLPLHSSTYQGGLFNKLELVWLNFCSRLYVLTFVAPPASVRSEIGKLVQYRGVLSSGPIVIRYLNTLGWLLSLELKSIFYKNVLIKLADPKNLQKRPHSLAAEQFQFLKLFRG